MDPFKEFFCLSCSSSLVSFPRNRVCPLCQNSDSVVKLNSLSDSFKKYITNTSVQEVSKSYYKYSYRFKVFFYYKKDYPISICQVIDIKRYSSIDPVIDSAIKEILTNITYENYISNMDTGVYYCNVVIDSNTRKVNKCYSYSVSRIKATKWCHTLLDCHNFLAIFILDSNRDVRIIRFSKEVSPCNKERYLNKTIKSNLLTRKVCEKLRALATGVYCGYFISTKDKICDISEIVETDWKTIQD